MEEVSKYKVHGGVGTAILRLLYKIARTIIYIIKANFLWSD